MSDQSVLLLHGALGTSKQLELLENKLAENYLVYTFNFEGHGESSSSNEFSIDLFTQNVKSFIEDNKLTSVHIFGYSMGGYVGLNYTSLYPNSVNKVITFGTKFKWTKVVASNEIKKLNPDAIELKVPKFAKLLSKIHSPSNWKVVVSKTAHMMEELGNKPPLTSYKLNSIKHSVLITVGNQDHMVCVKESEDVASSLKNGKLKILKDFVHPIERNDLNKMAMIIHDFIQS